MKNCCIVTTHPFWSELLGSGALIRSRHKLFQSIFDEVFVIFITKTRQICPFAGLTINYDNVVSKLQKLAISNFIEKRQIEYCHFSYISMSHIASGLKCKTGVEIHDILHVREMNFTKFGFKAPVSISEEQEISLLKNFDFIFSISTVETAYLKKKGLQCEYLPPSGDFDPIPNSETSFQLGMIGSSAAPNVDGLKHIAQYTSFKHKILISGALTFSEPAKKILSERVILGGKVKDVKDHYTQVQASLAPIRFGAGLKIKVLESLSYARPSVATSHAIEGFPAGIDLVNVIEDDFKCWDDGLISETRSIALERIREYFLDHFSIEVAKKILRSVLF